MIIKLPDLKKLFSFKIGMALMILIAVNSCKKEESKEQAMKIVSKTIEERETSLKRPGASLTTKPSCKYWVAAIGGIHEGYASNPDYNMVVEHIRNMATLLVAQTFNTEMEARSAAYSFDSEARTYSSFYNMIWTPVKQDVPNLITSNCGDLDDPFLPGGGGGSGGGDNGGGGSGTRIITTDLSIKNNAKAKCALQKLLNNNAAFDHLVNEFVGADYNLKFKVSDNLNGTTSRGQTTYDPNNPRNFEIMLRTSFVNSAPIIHTVKTFLHEAFHAHLLQRTYASFGAQDISANWVKKPEDMELNELVDIVESKVAGTSLEGVHHEYMAKNIIKIVEGLQEFSRKYDSSFADFTDNDFRALAYEGLNETNYYINNIKNKPVDFFGSPMQADSVYTNSVVKIKTFSNVDCSK